ncbi:hypothetical protein J4233_03245 [Candidatus Pacearchaeota archaeon]|nr:hypothetical protein [Candidatus Pacearchaeota archaeon]
MKNVRVKETGGARRPYHILSNFIFFLNLIIALLIITGAWILAETEFGQSAMILGFLMLSISVLLKAVRWW